MALQQITQVEVDNRLLSHYNAGYNFADDEEERENFRTANNIMSPSVDLRLYPRNSSDYEETEEFVPGLSPAAQMFFNVDDLYEILESHFPDATEDQLNSYVDYLYRQEHDLATNKRDGLSEEIISQSVRSRTCRDGDLLDICVVCQSEYERGEMLGSLECGHEYHASCIQRWLTEKNCCPVCKRKAIGEEEEWSC